MGAALSKHPRDCNRFSRQLHETATRLARMSQRSIRPALKPRAPKIAGDRLITLSRAMLYKFQWPFILLQVGHPTPGEADLAPSGQQTTMSINRNGRLKI